MNINRRRLELLVDEINNNASHFSDPSTCDQLESRLRTYILSTRGKSGSLVKNIPLSTYRFMLENEDKKLMDNFYLAYNRSLPSYQPVRNSQSAFSGWKKKILQVAAMAAMLIPTMGNTRPIPELEGLNVSVEQMSLQEQTKKQVEDQIQITADSIYAGLYSIRPSSGDFTSNYGWRWLYDDNTWKKDFHEAVDIAADPGIPVSSVTDGCVTGTGHTSQGSWIEIQSGDRVNKYLHIVPRVQEGDCVVEGELIATIANGPQPHLHWEHRIQKDNMSYFVDPVSTLTQEERRWVAQNAQRIEKWRIPTNYAQRSLNHTPDETFQNLIEIPARNYSQKLAHALILGTQLPNRFAVIDMNHTNLTPTYTVDQ